MLTSRRLHQAAAKLKPVCRRLHMHTCWAAWTRQYQHHLELHWVTLRQVGTANHAAQSAEHACKFRILANPFGYGARLLLAIDESHCPTPWA